MPTVNAMEKIPGLKQLLDDTEKKVEELIGRPVNVTYNIKIMGVTVSELMDIVCEACTVDRNDVLSQRRYQEIAKARQLFCWFAYRELKQTQAHIAKILERDHTTVIHSIKTVDDMIYTHNYSYITPFLTIKEKFMEMQKQKQL